MEKKENSSSRTYRLLFNALEEYGRIDEEHGILTTEQIKEISALLLDRIIATNPVGWTSPGPFSYNFLPRRPQRKERTRNK